MTTETCRVVLESGAVGSLEVGVTADGWRDVGGRQYHPATPLRAAIAHAAWDRDWPAREILAPGELSAEERVAAERARCAAVCRARAEKHRKTAAEETAAAEYGEALESGVTAREADACAEAIERGAVER